MFFKYFIHLCKSTLFLNFAWLFPPRLVRWGLRTGQMDIYKILISNREPAPIMKTPLITHPCFVYIFAALLALHFYSYFFIGSLLSRGRGTGYLYRPHSGRRSVLGEKANMSSLSLSCIGLVFHNVRLQGNVGCRLQKNPCRLQTVELIPLFISCFPQIF